jgi:programmed cell death protein 5
MPTEEEIKKRLIHQKLQEHMASQQGEMLQASMQQQQMEEALKTVRMQMLEPKARERLANLRTVKPDLATSLEIYLAQLYQSGQLKSRITDEQLVMILRKLSEKRDFKIRRK